MGKAYAYGSNITSFIYSTTLNKYCKMFKCVRTAEGVRLDKTIIVGEEGTCCLWASPRQAYAYGSNITSLIYYSILNKVVKVLNCFDP